MRRPANDKSYLAIRRWVDRDLASYPRNSIALTVPALIAGLALAAVGLVGWGALVIFWLTIFPAGACWTAFVLWRAARLMRATSIKGDRDYDRRGKFMLPLEYADSESALAAKRRRRKSDHAPTR